VTSGIASLYLRINLLIAGGYVFFRCAEFFLGSRKLNIKQSSMLRSGQCLLLGACLIPIFLDVIPIGALTHFSPDVGSLLESETVDPLFSLKKRFSTAPAGSRNESTPFAQNLGKGGDLYWMLEATLFVGMVLIFLIRARGLYVQRRMLIRTLVSGTPFRKIGKASIVVSQDVVVPFSALARGRAWVALPENLLGRWTDFKLALSHELQHHRQRDTLWSLIIELLALIFALNPAIYLWKRRISETQELSCDEALIGHKVSSFDYGSCLVRVAEAALGKRQMFAGTASMAAGSESPTYFKSFLRRRIEMLSQDKKRSPLRGALIGTIGLLLTVVTACAVKKVVEPKDVEKASPGVVETDPEIQKIADSALQAALDRHHASLGFVVVSDPVTGRILAVANQDKKEKHSPQNPHWALALRLGLASLAKPLIAASAIDKGVTTFKEVHNCENGSYQWAGHTYSDWKPFDKLSTADTVIQSGDICSIKVGQRLGGTGLAASLKNFGFGVGGVAQGFPEARDGEVPATKISEDPSFIADISSGMGSLYATPIEVVQAFGAIANGGSLLRPQSATGSVTPVVIRRVLSKETADEMKEVLAQVVTRGTASTLGSSPYRLAGKTATGYSREHARVEGHNLIPNLAAFAGFAPVEAPRVVIYVGVENPTDKKGAFGSYHAAPVFKEVAEKTLQYLKVPAGT
jgi:beta-lactamase regulating signal transducer with metallopeptidase domain